MVTARGVNPSTACTHTDLQQALKSALGSAGGTIAVRERSVRGMFDLFGRLLVAMLTVQQFNRSRRSRPGSNSARSACRRPFSRNLQHAQLQRLPHMLSGSTLTGLRVQSGAQGAKATFLQHVRIVQHRNELLRRRRLSRISARNTRGQSRQPRLRA